MHGLEVEEIIDRRGQYEKVVVGEIVAIKPHPNADKLRLAHVITKPGGPPQEIVCGAPNIQVGQKVPVALLGAKLPNGLSISTRNIRGVQSNGMICAMDELGLGKDHRGVMILDRNLKVGTPFVEAMGFDDIVFDLTTPANRADLMSVHGLAREIGAMLNKTVTSAPVKVRQGKTLAAKSIQIKIANPKLVPVYVLRVIRGVQVGQSPAAMQQYLQSVGMRSINSIVDAANFTMLVEGQPLHAFDAAKVTGPITVRLAKPGEHLVTLDGQDRQLDPSMLVIADSKGPIALAGIMGGRNSEVTAATKDIILEAAIFDPVSIRKTSRKLGVVSEASKRFEKGLWPSLPDQASESAAGLITRLAGGVVEKGSVKSSVTKAKQKTIVFDPGYVTERLGMKVSAATMKVLLTKLGFKISGGKQWKVIVPEWRLDVSLPEDLVDEVGRMTGYEKLPVAWPSTPSIPGPVSAMTKLKDEIRHYFSGQNFTEVITHSYYGSNDAATVKGEHIEVANPLDKTQQHLRRSLIPAITKILRAAADAGEDVRVFEIGRIFDTPSNQPWKLAFGISAKADQAHTAEELVSGMLDALGTKPQNHLAMTEKGRTIVIAEFDVDPSGIHFKKTSKFPATRRDVSFWLPPGQENAIKKAIIDSRIKDIASLSLKDKFSQDGKTSYTVSLLFQAPAHALTKADVDILEKKVKDALVKLGAEIR